MESAIGRKLMRNEHVHHIDGDTKNNDLSNLVLLSDSDHAKEHHTGVAKSQELKDKLSMSLKGKYVGENSFTNILCDADVIEIKHMLQQGIKHRIIADRFGINVRTVSHINVGRRWSHIKI
jgi:DNA-binding NarL/FixJ family response regulator